MAAIARNGDATSYSDSSHLHPHTSVAHGGRDSESETEEFVDGPGPHIVSDVVLDVDTGVDDAHALLLAVRHPSLRVLAVTTVCGNSDVHTVTKSTLKVLDAAGARSDLPVAVGCTRPLIEPPHGCPEIHGQDSLGDLFPPLTPSKRETVDDHAVAFLHRMLATRERNNKPPLTIIALGPLTNIAMLVRLAPDLVRRAVSRVVWMGGAASSGGNMRPWTEANAGYDPEAARIVLETSGVEILMYTWDAYVHVAYEKDELLKMGNCEVNTKGEACASVGLPAWSTLSTRLLLRDMAHFGMSQAMIGDAGAVAVAILGERAMTSRHCHVSVELRGEKTRGMTVVDHRVEVFAPDELRQPENVHVVTEVDAAAVKECFTKWVLSGAPLVDA